VHERHQEGFDGVEFSRGDGAIMREIVDDPPCRAVIARESCECPRLHEGYVRMPTLKVLAARWSLNRSKRRCPSECPLSGLSFTGRAGFPFLIDLRPPLPPGILRPLLSALRRQIDALLEIHMSQRSLL
jgi:hypothetical protein